MLILPTKIHLALEYFGVRSRSYFHNETISTYKALDPLAYYTAQIGRAHYNGVCDEKGIPLYRIGSESGHLPVQVAFWALGNFEHWRESKDESALAKVQLAAEWFVANQKSGGLWLTPFSSKRFGLDRDHQSAMVQGLAISTLLRANSVISNQRLLSAARLALEPFGREVRSGGVTEFVNGHPIYEEYPCKPPRHVLNGTIYALWGLNDAKRLANDVHAENLFNDGVRGLLSILPQFDSGYWSWYHVGEGVQNPATILYHRLHVVQLRVMAEMTGNQEFSTIADRFQQYLSSRMNAIRTLPKKIFWLIAGSI
ncbi:MAG: D-glucuronyl C5-epimerase family protein [Candidatus Zixiibacteriota bacterium]